MIVVDEFIITWILPFVPKRELKMKGYVEEQSEYLNSGLFGDKLLSP